MKRLLISCSTLVLVGLTSCDRGPDSSSTPFITSTGTFKRFDDKLTVAVIETPEGQINYTVTRGFSTAGPKDSPIPRGSNWFIYPVSADSIWAYHGDNRNVLLIECTEQNGGSKFKFTSNQVDTDLVRRAPREFVERLPPNVIPR